MKICGIDIGLCHTGYAIMNDKELHYGQINTSSKEEITLRINRLYTSMKKVVEKFRPDLIILEKMFINCNSATSMNFAAVRGVMLLLIGRKNITYKEINAKSVRKQVINNGNANKSAVQYFVNAYIKEKQYIIKEKITHHIYDAILLCIYGRL